MAGWWAVPTRCPRLSLALTILLVLAPVPTCRSAGVVNSAPQFLAGGDMLRFALPEDTQVGAPVYRLQGSDPEGSRVHYSISGQHFEVDRSNGIVSLVRPLDRETQPILEVIISITDEAFGGEDPNTVSLRREIPVLDVNDNPPEFHGRPYSVVLLENTKPGSIVFPNITILDADAAQNAEISLICVSGGCDTFSVSAEKIAEGNYRGLVTLSKPLDFEMTSSYSLSIQATDLSEKNSLSATANIAISVRDVQDQPPVFLGAPYSATLQENTSPGYQVLKIRAKDGDSGDPRPVILSLEGDTLNYFKLVQNSLVTSHNPIDRENPLIRQNGGVYTFSVKATELINNELPGDFSSELITIVITDVDDQIPKFNEPIFHINVTEDITIGTPLPGLSMVVDDNDLGENSKYSLKLKSTDHRALDWFNVEPAEAYGRTPVVVRLKDNSGLDYDSGVRQVQFKVEASVRTTQGDPIEVSSSTVFVKILDANDNSPTFDRASYSFSIPEDLPVGTNFANITAQDADDEDFGTVTYALRGFGTNKFGINSKTGNLFLMNRVDYEKQKSYSLSLEARDGGGRVTTVSILVSLVDINDNAPKFESTQYQRTVREGATSFQPQFFIRAEDADNDGENEIRYKVVTSDSDVLDVDENTGEIKILSPVSSSHTSRGQYEMIVRALDSGTPPLHSDVAVVIRVGVPGNQRPVFRGVPYNVTLLETADSGQPVVTVKATDPDGPDTAIHYRIANGADNFVINGSSGVITVSPAAILDPDITMVRRYAVTVLAVDTGSPVRETAQTTVIVNIKDVNNKAPYFLEDSNYVRHISENTDTGKTVLTVKAIDEDLDADIKYTIEDVRAMHKTGVPVAEGAGYNFKNAFVINAETGEISVNSHLNHQATAVIILMVKARDKNAVVNKEQQIAKAEVAIYIQAYDEKNPKFTLGCWTATDPTINSSLVEEKPIGSLVMTLSALDPIDGSTINRFSLVPPLSSMIDMDSRGGVTVAQRIDYETMTEKTVTFRVEAYAKDGVRSSIATVILNIEDINDHSPMFKKSTYEGQISESVPKNTFVLQVEATDGDRSNTLAGYGDVIYSLTGENTGLFNIDRTTGRITVSGNGTIDREAQSILRLTAVAADTPLGGASQRKTFVSVIIEVLDVNDNRPIFDSSEYTGVVLENVLEGTSVVNISATDSDTGPGGIVEYEIVHESDAEGLFKINKRTGELITRRALTGKGRIEPFDLTIRAQDQGEPSLFTDVPLKVYIGDVVSNDGIPSFIHPTLDEMAYISENSSIGSPVFRVIASDPDNPNSPEGQVRFSFLQDSTVSLAFSIDPVTGLITTKKPLDRELKSNYTVILIAQDSGTVPQHTTRELKISVTDIDDNKPVFKRAVDEAPLEFSIKEELPVGSSVGVIEAFDEDIGENALIGYLITYGNEDGVFSLSRLDNNSAILNVTGRIDRESGDEHLLTVKCFKLSAKPNSLRKIYNKQDLSERLVRIKVIDIDDNLPKFSKHNETLGVRVNVPHGTLLHTVSAVDDDSDAQPIAYSVERVAYSGNNRNIPPSENASLIDMFTLDNTTGELRTAASLADYYDGYFTVRVSALNRQDGGKVFTDLNVYVVRDRGLMKFVFSVPPGEVRSSLANFKTEVESILSLPVSLNIYDTQFLSKGDGSLDFSATSSCFQLVGARTFDVKEMEKLMAPVSSESLQNVYKKYNVQSVGRCVPQLIKAGVTWVQMAVLAIAGLIGIASMISGCVLCCTYQRWQRIR